MPVYSMTGYASVQSTASTTETGSSGSMGLEIRSVNSRFLDLTFKLPEELRAQESALREMLMAQLKRGKIEVRAFIDRQHNAGVVEPNAKTLQRLNAAQDNIRAWLPQAAPLSVAEVMALCAHQQSGPSQDWGPVALSLMEQAIAGLRDARQREGKRLAEMLLDRIAQLQALAQQAQPLIPQLVEQQRQRFLERWKEAMALGDETVTPQAAQERALSEATAFAIRIDVAEELTRLASHLDEIARLIKKGGEIGKRLDFLIQELHREANTMGSKSAALELTRVSVDMKVLIEQMREQVQNIE
ncbi:YicC/YloC family endoribonuclease [Curvibacter sp. APW13]|uniref:YicC/YloC family endoribonuclease n=1 Tax=Curvibacter sp. APW13 TaxID=3077236 RepID=UPI0028E039D7|nr:YicC/YloC family endoribonuclease [Curvibacter sp. APW13]MDT8992438.1 YicC/YloC family endoribonuclease [Curvibacter sp. APW13]